MAKIKRLRWPGLLVGWGLFLVIGLPWSFLSLLGERLCDTGGVPPCAISWEESHLILFAVVIALCWLAGWATNYVVYRERLERRAKAEEKQT